MVVCVVYVGYVVCVVYVVSLVYVVEEVYEKCVNLYVHVYAHV